MKIADGWSVDVYVGNKLVLLRGYWKEGVTKDGGGGEEMSCGLNGHIFFWMGNKDIPEGLPCECGETRWHRTTELRSVEILERVAPASPSLRDAVLGVLEEWEKPKILNDLQSMRPLAHRIDALRAALEAEDKDV